MFDNDLQILTLAQAEGQPPPGAGTVPLAPDGGQPLTGAPPGSPTGSRPDPFGSLFIPIILVIVVMFAFTMMGQRRDRKKREAMIGALKKHDRVQTIGGVIGSIVDVGADHVVLKVDESSNTRITFARSAVQQVLSVSDGGEKPSIAP